MAPSLRLGCSALALLLAVPALAQDRAVTYNYYGTPGLLEMPSAISDDDGEIAGTVSYFGGQLRNSFTFQITPRLSGTFRYSGINEFFRNGGDLWDRSFDLRYRFNDEGIWVPMFAVGLQDFLGTGVYSGEYVVATKTVGDAFRVTAGLGWGRLGSYNGFTNPLGVIDDRLEERPDNFEAGEDQGGTVAFESLFRGDAALFGGVEWAPNERWVFKAEYSSDDAYVGNRGQPLFDRDSPFNFGVTWRPAPGLQFNLGYLYGSELSFSGTIAINPNERIFWSGLDPAPQPVAVRPADLAAARSWDRASLPEPALRDRLAAALRTEGVELTGIELTDRTARVRYTNTRYRTEAQAMGRIARILTQELPPSTELLTLEPMQAGIPLSAATFARSDLERFENEVGGTAATFARVDFNGAGAAAGLAPVPPARDAFSWGLRPYFGLTVFDPQEPVQLSFGAELSAAYRIRPNLILSGSIRQQLLSTADDEENEPKPEYELPRVRTNAGVYLDNESPVISDLTLAWYGRPGRDLYSRVTVGYLEMMYGGISTELLWKPVESPLGVGVEVNYVQQRDFDQLLGFQDYDVVTGHVSAYYDFGNGFQGQVDAGRYLAGDWGATFALDREFENGWRVGAYFTLTDVPFETFGEGSFDKGIRLSIPVDYIFGTPTRRAINSTLQSLNKDGGARLEVEGRLYDIVRQGHFEDLEDSWGRFWR